MKKLYPLFILLFPVAFCHAQISAFCNPGGNVILYSNYDGGDLTINVDQNIPNIKIGIVSYEFAHIHITGAYAGNVTEVRWAGYNGANNHCSLGNPWSTTIDGVPNNADTMIVMPANSYFNTYGYNYIICNYSCNNTSSQGGCNTPDQIVDYFMAQFGGTLCYHHTQYGCWSGTYNMSTGGNCCIMPTTLGINQWLIPSLSISPNPSGGNVLLRVGSVQGGVLHVENLLGESVKDLEVEAGTHEIALDLSDLRDGMYVVTFTSNGNIAEQKVVIQH